MNKELWALAAQSLRRRKKNSLLLLAVLFLSFAFSVASLAVTETVEKTNEEYLFNTYGAWKGAIVDGSVKDEEFLRGEEWLQKLGITRSAGTFGGRYTIGTADEGFFEMSRFTLQSGRMPRAANEIAIEASTLDTMGLDFDLGQTITLTISFTASYDKTISADVEFKLCGVLRAYSAVWGLWSDNGDPVLNNAFVSEEGFKRVRDAAEEEAARIRQEAIDREAAGGKSSGLKHLSLGYVRTHYFFTFDEKEDYVYDRVQEHYTGGRPPNWAGRPVRNHLRFNYAGYGDSLDPNVTTTEADRDASAALIYTGFIFVSVLLAIFCIYAVQMQKQVRQFALFRSIGVTRRQLRRMMLFETLMLCAPAAALGTVAGVLGAKGMFKLLDISGSAQVAATMPWNLVGPMALVWVLGVLLTRLLILHIALREPLTGRISADGRKLRRYRRLRVAMAGALAVLLCGSLIFTVAESFPPAHQMAVENAKPAFLIQSGQGRIDEWTIKQWQDILGVTDVRAVGELTPNMSFDGCENAQAFQDVLERLENNDKVTGTGTTSAIDGKAAIGVKLYVLPEGAPDSFVDLSGSGMDMEAFKRGELIAVSFPQEPDGSYYMDSTVYKRVLERHVTGTGERTVEKEYKLHKDATDAGLRPGSAVTLEFMTSPVALSDEEALEAGYTGEEIAMYKDMGLKITEAKSAAVLHPTVGAVVPVPSGTDTSFLGLDEKVYVFWCSEAFARNMLEAAAQKPDVRGASVGPYVIGNAFGFSSAEVFTDKITGEYTAVKVQENCGGLEFSTQQRETSAKAQEHAQSLILLLFSGGCITLLLLLVLGDALIMESERLKKNYGVMQALGMSRRQLKRKLLGSALRRGAAGAALGWLVWCCYAAVRAAVLYIGQLNAPLVLRYGPMQALRETIWRYMYAGAGIGTAALLTVLAAALVAGEYLFANRGLFRENLMDKLREET